MRREPARRGATEPIAPTDLQEEVLRAAARMVSREHVHRLLYVSDLPPPGYLVGADVTPKLVRVVADAQQRDALDAEGMSALLVPAYDLDRQDKVKLALLGATARGYIRPGDHVVAVVGRRPDAFPDMLLVVEIEKSAVEPTLFGEIGSGRISPAVFDAVVELAVELGLEGWEGHALGTMFVIGDVPRVMKASRQLALNPFQGYSEAERNLVDPAVRDALRSFATLDGAFVVREDGVVEAAGRYLQFAPRDVEIPLGLGARHMAAALVTAATEAIAVVVSQATGSVRVFRQGAVVLQLTPRHRRT